VQVNSLSKIFGAFFAYVCLSFTASGSAQALSAENAVAVEAQVNSFYTWYLPATSKKGDPLRTARAKMNQFVSKALLAEIDKLIADDDLDADYFTQSQDNLEDWPSNIMASNTQVKANRATTVLTLGASKKTKRKLQVTLIKEDEQWKIRRVKPFNAIQKP
jgi:hypothetical protein